jgi:AcrR family transcriptional regulator
MEEKSKPKPPVAAAQQSRSQRTQAAILNVVRKRLHDGTFDETSVQDIVSEAGCSVGAFYGRFANKAAALFRFYDNNCTELERQVSEILDPARSNSLAALLGEFTAAIVDKTFSGAAILRADTLRSEMVEGSAFMVRAQTMNAIVLEDIERCLDARKKEFNKTPGKETALFVLALVGGLSRDAVLNGASLVESSRRIDANRFKHELTDAVSGYLGIRGSESTA